MGCEMSEAKFTKGEWKGLSGDKFQKEFVITIDERWNNGQDVICEMDVIFAGDNGKEQAANAHLIGAAPELYRMLDAIASLRMLPPEHKLEQLLAKARGEHD